MGCLTPKLDGLRMSGGDEGRIAGLRRSRKWKLQPCDGLLSLIALFIDYGERAQLEPGMERSRKAETLAPTKAGAWARVQQPSGRGHRSIYQR